jgi:hypothetical protein
MANAPEPIDVEKARRRLKELATTSDSQGTFWLACEAAHKNRDTPRDPKGLLRGAGQFAFTGENGKWLEGCRELVIQLTAVDPVDDMNYIVLEPAPMPVAEAA